MKSHKDVSGLPEDVLNELPVLAQGGCRKTSERTPVYNCIAFAAGDETRWWEPPFFGFTGRGCYWPSDAPTDNDLNSYIRVFELLGYVICDSQEWEEGYEKIAVYWGQGGPHAAKQNSSRKWKSKLGKREDIEHDSLSVLESQSMLNGYGRVRQVLKRPLK